MAHILWSLEALVPNRSNAERLDRYYEDRRITSVRMVMIATRSVGHLAKSCDDDDDIVVDADDVNHATSDHEHHNGNNEDTGEN